MGPRTRIAIPDVGDGTVDLRLIEGPGLTLPELEDSSGIDELGR